MLLPLLHATVIAGMVVFLLLYILIIAIHMHVTLNDSTFLCLQVRLVRFRPQGDRLATYDSWGNIKLWANRANVLALESSLSTTMVVTDMQWSSCGFYVVICGEEGYIQILSGMNGQRLFVTQVVAPHRFSTQAEFTCCTWNKSNTQIALGTRRGEVFGIDPNEEGHFIFTTLDREGVAVQSLHFFGPVHEIPMNTRNGEKMTATQSLSLYLSNGDIVFFPTLISKFCACVKTQLIKGIAQWNSEDTLLAVVGHREEAHQVLGARFLDAHGDILLTVNQALCIPQGIQVNV